MLIVLQAHCLKFEVTGIHLNQPLANSNPVYSKGMRVRFAQHACATVRLLRRPKFLATCAVLTAVAGAFTGQHIVTRMEAAAGSVPLAPAPAAPAPPAPLNLHQKHHFFGNPLHGLASWYGSMWNGRTTASGETYDESQMTAAHKSLPLGTRVRVTNLASMRSVVVRINDRGAFAPHRVIDVSSAAARELGIMDKGLTRVELQVLGKF